MCFSASISFAAATLLLFEGVLATQASPTRRHLPLAAVPVLFAAQQACEGALWTEIAHARSHVVTSIYGYGFLFFAFAIWPFYLPFALELLEPSRGRRKALLVMSAAGLIIGGYLLACVTFRPTDVCMAQGSLYYWVQVDTEVRAVAPFAYLTIVLIPLALSSLRGTSLFGLALAVGFTASVLCTRAGFLSTWCFSAAIVSGLVILILRAERRRLRSSMDRLFQQPESLQQAAVGDLGY